MGKDHKKKHDDDKRHANGNRLNDDVKAFIKMSAKKFKKENKYRLEGCDGKKEKKRVLKDISREYYEELESLLPATLKFAITQGHHRGNEEAMQEIYAKLFDEDFVKFLTKELKDDAEITNIDMLPSLITAFISKAKKEQPDKAELFATEGMSALLKAILKKRIKKMTKKGIPENQAFDYLSILPNPEILARGVYFYCARLFTCMYDYAASEDVDFDTVMKVLFKGESDNKDFSAFDLFILLERKDKITNFNDSQKSLFNKITTWSLNDIEDHKTSDIERIIRTYLNRRMEDAKNNKDSNRRLYLSSVSETDYPKIFKVVSSLAENENFKKYL